MIPNPAQYLLRFDDLCPTQGREQWLRCLSLIEEFGIRPILAVVPDNHDPQLAVEPTNLEFWPQMQVLESAGASIALHGYHHLCRSSGRSLLPLHTQTEFSGVPESVQRDWIRAGLGILRGHGLNPKLWVAPRHGFDRATLRALRCEGIKVLSDGFARTPFVRGGMIWIPQQLWAPVFKRSGLWTICLHPYSLSRADLLLLRNFLERHSSQFTSVDRVLAELQPERLNLNERAYELLALLRVRASRLKKRMTRVQRHARTAKR